ncbi:MAG: hypothetical protein R2940_15775 [Syntrophotaleaceae bacterium]
MFLFFLNRPSRDKIFPFFFGAVGDGGAPEDGEDFVVPFGTGGTGAKKLPFSVDDIEQIVEFADVLGGAEKQKPPLSEAVVQQGQNLFLQLLIHVDEQVAATHQIEVAEGGIAGEVVGGEDDHFPQLAGNFVQTGAAAEVAAQASFIHLPGDALRVDPLPPDLQALGVDIGGKDLDLELPLHPVHQLQQHDGDGVGLLAGGTPRHPDPHRPVGGMFLEHLLQFILQGGESLQIAEKAGDVDQQIDEQGLGLGSVAAQEAEVVFEALEAVQGHAALYAAAQGVLLVTGEIVAGGFLHQVEDLIDPLFQSIFGPGLHKFPPGLARLEAKLHQLAPHLLHRQDEVHQASLYGGVRHPFVLGLLLFLSHYQAAGGIDRPQFLGSVASGPGEDDADGILSEGLGHVEEEPVDQPQRVAGDLD